MIFATVHGDCHSISDIATLKNYSDLWLTVTSPDFKRTEFLKRHSKGKVEFKKYNLEIENFVLKNALLSKKVEKRSVSQEAAETLPTSTFNLQLNKKELEDRSQLEMPYWKDKKDPKIEYIPDDNDDWDDEDPDDDLDI